MEERGLPVLQDACRQGPGTIEFGRATTTGLVRATTPPTALIYGSADLALGGLEALRKSSLTLPGDLSVIGFGDPHWLRLFDPGISTIGLALSESAEAAISMLLRQIEAREKGIETGDEPSLELEPFLILRESTAPPRAGG
jgi:DNA-binding LacI/PurR family transcriptional regulator